MAVADPSTVVEHSSPPVILDESGSVKKTWTKTTTTSPDGTNNSVGSSGGSGDSKGNLPATRRSSITKNPSLPTTILTAEDNGDSTATITSTTSSLFVNSLSGFLMNRRLHQQQQHGGHAKSQSPARMASFSKNLKHVARVSSRNLNISLARSKLYNSFPNLSRKENQQQINQAFSIDDENVRKVLKAVESDHVVSTFGADNRNRRTVYLEKTSNSDKFGFTIQSYTFRHAKTNRTEQVTYVDYVDLNSAAFVAGLRPGDLILAINGRNVQDETHQQLVTYIGQCSSLRMVVLFDNCVNRIELCAKAIKLKKLLSDKEFELRMLVCQEQRIQSGLAPFTDVEILALLRTPCNTPRSVSFSLPSKNDSGYATTTRTPSSSTCPRRPSAPTRGEPPPGSTNIYYVNEEEDETTTTPRANDLNRAIVFDDDEEEVVSNNSDSIHFMDVDVDDDEDEDQIDHEDVAEMHNTSTTTRTTPATMTTIEKNGELLDSSTDWNDEERKMADFILGSDAGSSSDLPTSSSCRSSFRTMSCSDDQTPATAAAACYDGDSSVDDSSSAIPVDSGHVTGDDLALIHILHIDDTRDDSKNSSSAAVESSLEPSNENADQSSDAITHF